MDKSKRAISCTHASVVLVPNNHFLYYSTNQHANPAKHSLLINKYLAQCQLNLHLEG